MKLMTVFVTASALVAMTGGIASAAEAHSPSEKLSGVAAVEAATGTEDLLHVAPGETSGQVYVPASGNGVASVVANDLSLSFGQPVAGPTTTELSADGTLSYLATDSAYDLHLQAIESPDSTILSDGLRSLIEIQNSHAPTEYVYPVHLAKGAKMVVHDDGSVTGSQDGEIVMIVPAPWAVDNAGITVPTSYEVRGSDLVQHVDYSSSHQFPIIADPVWFVPLIIAGGRVVGQVAVKAASKAAAKRAAAAQAARIVAKTVKGRITSASAKNCYKGAGIGSGASVVISVQQMGDGRWKARIGDGAFEAVTLGVAGCLTTKIKQQEKK